MAIGFEAAQRASEVLVALAIGIGSLELLATRRSWGDDGTWRWSILRTELPWGSPLLATTPFTLLLLTRVVAAVWLVWTPSLAAVAWLWMTTLLANVRFRGTYNGGSDHMLMVVLTALLIGRVGAAYPEVVRLAVVWIGVQALLSYTVAGVAKLRNADWRRGTALPVLLAIPAYGVPVPLRSLLNRPGVARAAAWGVLVFECGFPLVLLGPQAAAAGIALAAAFHLANAWLFGLNRFLLTWAATWPALLYVAEVSGG